MAEIQGRSGDSLAGIYDVRGGSYDVGRLGEGEVNLVHEMGGTIASERLRTDLRLVEQLAVAQSTAFNATIDDLPGGPFRLQGGIIFASVASTIANATLSMELGDGSRSFPLITWWTGDPTRSTEIKFGSGLTTVTMLVPIVNSIFFPVLGLGEFQGNPNQQNRILRLSGNTSAFGAGTVDIRAMVMSTHMNIPGGAQQPRSWGLPIPSW